MAMTLLEAAKLNSGDEIQRAIIEIYAAAHPILGALPFDPIQGNALRYNQESTLPGIGFRGVNEGFSESTGVINPVVEPLVIAGGDLDVDRFIIKTMGEGQRAVQEAMKVKALAHRWAHAFIKGDSSAQSKEFDGLQRRLTGSQLVAAGSTSGGDALSLAKLDEAIDKTDMPTHIIISQAMRRRLTQATRDGTVSGEIQWQLNQFGQRVQTYQGLEFLIADENDQVYDTLAFDEANPGGGSAVGTSLYVVSLREQMLQGIQNDLPDVRDLGELESKPVFRTRVEWYAGIALFHPRAATRLWGVKDAAVVK